MDDSELLRLVTLAVAEDEGYEPHAFRVSAHGEIDIESAAQLSQTLDDLIERGAKIVIFDASGVEFLDSSGLRVIVKAGNDLSAAGGQLLIEGMSGAVQRVLEVSGLIDHYRAQS